MPDSMGDNLHSRLSALESDLTGISPAGPAAARRRAAQRTRHQVAGAALATVAALVVGLGVLDRADFSGTPQPAETPTTEVEPAPDEALLTIDDITGDTGIAWTPTDDPAEPFDCAPAAPEGSTQVHYVNPDGGRLDQFVEATGDAAERFTQLQEQIDSCVAAMEENAPDGTAYRLVESWRLEGRGDDVWMAAYFAPLQQPSDFTEASVVLVSVARSGDYVSVVVDGGPGTEFNTPEPLHERTALAVERLCTGLGDPCDEDSTLERLYPAPAGDLPGWLTTDDVVRATGLPLSDGGEVWPADGWNFAGLPLDPAGAGAVTVELRSYHDAADPAAMSLDQIVAAFPDENSARRHYAELVDAADAFEQEGDVITRTGAIEGENYAGTTWRSENTEFGTVFVYGVVTIGDTVAAVTHGIDSAAERDVAPDQLAELLHRAAERIGG